MEYEKCFQPLQERGASRHIITCEDPNLLLAVDRLVSTGVIVGQGEMMSEDIIYYLNPERENVQIKPVQLNGEPLYLTPQERLQRPTHEELRLKRGGRVL